MPKKKKPETIPPATLPIEVEVVKNEILKEGPVEERRSLIKTDVKSTPLGKGVALICDHCYVRDRCSEFKPGQECVFQKDVPKIETGADIRGAIMSLLSLQVQRINTARNIENLDGGYPDSSLSAEMDRFVELARILREISDQRDTLDLHIKGPGIITRIFGDMMKKNTGSP